MGVAGAGGCCCGKCCKPKDWLFNYPYYVQGEPNPWKGDGRPLNPEIFKLVKWTKNGAWSVVATLPDGIQCKPKRTYGKIRFVMGSAFKALTVSEDTPIGIRVTGHAQAGFGFTVLVVIQGCGKAGGTNDFDSPFSNGFYRREFEIQRAVGDSYTYGYDTANWCDDFTLTFTDRATLAVGPSKISIYFSKTGWVGDGNVTITFQGLNAENECK